MPYKNYADKLVNAKKYYLKIKNENPEKMRQDSKLRSRKWRENNPDRVKEIKHDYCIRSREKLKLYARIRRKEYPEKISARKMVQYRIKTGQIIRKPCEICENEKSHAHHDDYSKPLIIRWLCAKHHNEYHKLKGDIR